MVNKNVPGLSQETLTLTRHSSYQIRDTPVIGLSATTDGSIMLNWIPIHANKT